MLRFNKLAWSVVVSTICCGSVMAAQVPEPAKQDPRVRFIDYDPYDIATIKVRIGRDTLIMFSEGEQILDMGGGYTEAWNVGAITAGNGLFIKPTRSSPNTNIHILTNKRWYNLDMVKAKNNEHSYEFVKYRYPEEELKKKWEKAQEDLAKRYLTYGHPANNRNYTVQGSDSVAPSFGEDNGQFTYFRFPANSPIPQIYIETEDGRERLVQWHMKDDVLVVHKVAPKFIFRSGELVACAFNEGFDPNGARPKTNTSSPKVKRVLKEAQQ